MTFLTRSLREPGGPCTMSMEVSESHMERVNLTGPFLMKKYFVCFVFVVLCFLIFLCYTFQMMMLPFIYCIP